MPPIRDVRYIAPANVSVDATTTIVLPENGARTYLLLVNDSNEKIYLGIGSPAVAGKGPRLNAEGGFFEMIRDRNLSNQPINAISASGGKNLTIQEAEQRPKS